MRELVGCSQKFFERCCLKKFLVATFLALGLFGAAEAKPLPEIVWSHDVYTIAISDDNQHAEKRRGYQLLNAGTPEEQKQNRDRIANAIAAKIKEQEAKLPFKLKTTFEDENLSEVNTELNDQTAGDVPIALVPIVVIDYAIEQSYEINGKPHYKYVIISAVDIAFCSEDEDGALTILSNIPLHFYESIPLSNSFE